MRISLYHIHWTITTSRAHTFLGMHSMYFKPAVVNYQLSQTCFLEFSEPNRVEGVLCKIYLLHAITVTQEPSTTGKTQHHQLLVFSQPDLA